MLKHPQTKELGVQPGQSAYQSASQVRLRWARFTILTERRWRVLMGASCAFTER